MVSLEHGFQLARPRLRSRPAFGDYDGPGSRQARRRGGRSLITLPGCTSRKAPSSCSTARHGSPGAFSSHRLLLSLQSPGLTAFRAEASSMFRLPSLVRLPARLCITVICRARPHSPPFQPAKQEYINFSLSLFSCF